jgi:engulfment/cell motility protein 1
MVAVAVLIDIRIKAALRSEHVREWLAVEHDFNGAEYRAVRDRQMKELELEDDLLSKVPVRYVGLPSVLHRSIQCGPAI